METEKPRIGEGVFTAKDAAKILNINIRQAKYWFSYYLKHDHFKSNNYRYYFQFKDTLAVNFLTLMEIYVFYSLKSCKISTKKIIDTHKYLSNKLNNPYPFTQKSIYTNGGELLIKDNGQFLTTDGREQSKIGFELDKFFKKINFSQDGTALSFHPLGVQNAVVIDPNHQFGKPTIEGTNIKVSTIFNLYKSGDEKETIAELYYITLKQINDVIEFSKVA